MQCVRRTLKIERLANPAAYKTARTDSAGLPAEQDYNTGRNGQDRHYQVQTLKVQMEQ
jgi:hypothetical protein